jgi:hypothetical protein
LWNSLGHALIDLITQKKTVAINGAGHNAMFAIHGHNVFFGQWGINAFSNELNLAI